MGYVVNDVEYGLTKYDVKKLEENVQILNLTQGRRSIYCLDYEFD